MKKEEVLKHFTSIYNHEYEKMPNENVSDDENNVDDYEIQYVALIFLGAVGIPVKETIIDQAIEIYGIFKVSLILNNLANENKISFQFNPKDNSYSYGIASADNKASPEEIQKHHDYLHKEFDDLANKFVELIDLAKKEEPTKDEEVIKSINN